jgi:hypothetical protein
MPSDNSALRDHALATIPAAALSAGVQQPPPTPDLQPLGKAVFTSPGGFTWYRLPTRPPRIIRHSIV